MLPTCKESWALRFNRPHSSQAHTKIKRCSEKARMSRQEINQQRIFVGTKLSLTQLVARSGTDPGKKKARGNSLRTRQNGLRIFSKIWCCSFRERSTWSLGTTLSRSSTKTWFRDAQCLFQRTSRIAKCADEPSSKELFEVNDILEGQKGDQGGRPKNGQNFGRGKTGHL